MATVFFMTLVSGMLGVLATCRMDEVAWKFVRLMAIIALTIIAFVLAWFMFNIGGTAGSWAKAAAGATGAAGLAAFFVLSLTPVAVPYAAILRALAVLASGSALIAAWAWGFDAVLWPVESGSRTRLGAALIGQALSAMLLGAVLLATALGHAYLTQTAMPIRPLRRLAELFTLAVVLRLGWVLVAAGGMGWFAIRAGDLPDRLFHDHLLMIVIRGGVGLLVPTVLAFMVRETARLRATQSATGILYFTMVLVCIGELAGLYLVAQTGLPF